MPHVQARRDVALVGVGRLRCGHTAVAIRAVDDTHTDATTARGCARTPRSRAPLATPMSVSSSSSFFRFVCLFSLGRSARLDRVVRLVTSAAAARVVVDSIETVRVVDFLVAVVHTMHLSNAIVGRRRAATTTLGALCSSNILSLSLNACLLLLLVFLLASYLTPVGVLPLETRYVAWNGAHTSAVATLGNISAARCGHLAPTAVAIAVHVGLHALDGERSIAVATVDRTL